MGDAPKTKEKKKKKSVVRTCDLPIKDIKPKGAPESDEDEPVPAPVAEPEPAPALVPEKKKKKSVVRTCDLPIKDIKPKGVPESDEEEEVPAPVAEPEPAPAPVPEKKKKKSVVRTCDLPIKDIKPKGVPESDEEEEVEAPVEETETSKPSSRKQSSAPEETSASSEGGSRKTSAAVPIEEQNCRGGGEAVAASEHRRKESEVVKKSSGKKNLLDELDEDKLIELKEAFELFDLNGDGFIDIDDLRLTFASLGKPEMTDEELKNMLEEATNPMDFDSFVILLGFKTVALDPEEILRQALSSWDYKDSGLISEERIKHDLMTWGDKFDHAEAEGAFEDAPTFITNGQRMIDYIKFCKTLGGLRKKTSYDD